MPNIQNYVYDRIAWEPGWIPFRFNCGPIRGSHHSQAVTWGQHRNHAGVSDLAALVNGRVMVWIEIKQLGESHLDSQVAFAAEVKAQGGLVFTARTLDDVEAIIAEVNDEIQKHR